MFELDPAGNGRALTLRGTLPAAVANQGGLGNPVGATSTATMYRPGKILQVGGGWWGNGGGPAGARAGFTVDITGGTATPGRRGDRADEVPAPLGAPRRSCPTAT